MRRIEFAVRLLGTGIAFACVFFGGGVLAVTLLPALAMLPGHRQERARRTIHHAFRVYIATLCGLNLIRLRTVGLDKLHRAAGRMIVANHPSLLDVVLLMAVIPNAQCIIKHQLWTHRFLGPLMRAAGYIRNDLLPEDMIAACRDSLDRGNCLIIFPEGTRTIPGQPMHFRRGFANLATLTGAPVQPVTITCDPPTLIKGEEWWRLPPRTPLFTVTVSDCLDPDLYARYQYRSLAARRLVQALEAHYAEHL
ncbi:MAG TPA: lysophospholipid acyltransferase family protein [Rhodopila sp.]|nr:lysophospholipid acyltransferase family protein [Rhodopila sp.]